MKPTLSKLSTALLLSVLLFQILPKQTHAQDLRVQLQKIASEIAKKIEAKGKNRVVLSSFMNSANEETELGRYMADKFSIVMEAYNLNIIDRSQLNILLEQNKMKAQQILDPKTAPDLMKLTGAEVVLTGNYNVFNDNIEVTLKAIDLSKGVRLAGTEGVIPRTPEINNLLVTARNTAPEPKKIYDLPKVDCQPPGGSYYGKISIENQLAEPVILYWIYGPNHDTRAEQMIAPGTTYLSELILLGSDISSKNNYLFFHTSERDEENWRYIKQIVDVPGCKIKPLTLTTTNVFFGKTKPMP